MKNPILKIRQRSIISKITTPRNCEKNSIKTKLYGGVVLLVALKLMNLQNLLWFNKPELRF